VFHQIDVDGCSGEQPRRHRSDQLRKIGKDSP